MPIPSPNPRLARQRRLIAFALASAIVAVIAAAASICNFSLLPPRIGLRQLQPGAAVTRALVQLPPAHRLDTPLVFETQVKRANLIANVMASAPILDRVGSLMGIESDEIAATAEADASVPLVFTEPNGERRANQILVSRDPYRLDIQARSTTPILDIYAQAPSAEQAARLADASVKAANAYLQDLARQHPENGPAPVTLTQLGAARGGSLDPAAPIKIAALTLLTVFAVSFGLLCLLAQLRRGWLAADPASARLRPATDVRPVSSATARRDRDDWPHTTRLLPWMIAAFLAMLWLVPINAILVQASLPVDLKLDRLVLPVIVLVWLLSLAAGRPGAPRWRFTRIHAAIAVFVAVAFLSVVLNAAYLDHTLELGVAIKQLFLLGAFVLLFLVVASAVRATEIRAFMTFILILATICAVGIIWEYRVGTNLFYSWSAKLLPGFLHITLGGGGFDEVGRPEVTGPADLGLEAVAMLSMALPIALVRIIHSSRTRERFIYGLAVCILLGAILSTYRKSAFLAPISIGLILAYFRRRELLRLAPLATIILVAVAIHPPNALKSIVEQFEPSRLGVGTVSDRVSDYNAIRPDLLSFPTFGRGFGSYLHTSYRILDNELLDRIVETGLVGLAAYILMFAWIIATAAPIIRGRDPNWGPAALVVAAAAGAFLVMSVLFDILSFPQAPYIFMVLAGFLAVMTRQHADDSPQPAKVVPATRPVVSTEMEEAAEVSVPTLPTPV